MCLNEIEVTSYCLDRRRWNGLNMGIVCGDGQEHEYGLFVRLLDKSCTYVLSKEGHLLNRPCLNI